MGVAPELTLLVLKPESVIRGLFGRIITVVTRKGFRIVDLVPFQFTEEVVQKQYAEYMGDLGIKKNICFSLVKGLSYLVVLAGPRATKNLRNLIGDYRLPPGGTIRGTFMTSLQEGSVVHGSDNPQEFLADIRRLHPRFINLVLERIVAEQLVRDSLLENPQEETP